MAEIPGLRGDTRNYESDLKQHKHAARMKTIRALQEATGLSRTRIRQALNDFAKIQTNQQLQIQPTQKVDAAPRPEVRSELTQFNPRPLTLGITPDGGNGGGGGSPTATSPTPLEPVIDGLDTLYITDGTYGQNAEAASENSIPTIGGVKISLTGGSRPSINLTGTEGCVYLAAAISNDRQVTAVTVETDAGASAPVNDDDNSYLKIGTISWNGTQASVARNVTGSQNYSWCGQHNSHAI